MDNQVRSSLPELDCGTQIQTDLDDLDRIPDLSTQACQQELRSESPVHFQQASNNNSIPPLEAPTQPEDFETLLSPPRMRRASPIRASRKLARKRSRDRSLSPVRSPASAAQSAAAEDVENLASALRLVLSYKGSSGVAGGEFTKYLCKAHSKWSDEKLISRAIQHLVEADDIVVRVTTDLKQVHYSLLEETLFWDSKQMHISDAWIQETLRMALNNKPEHMLNLLADLTDFFRVSA